MVVLLGRFAAGQGLLVMLGCLHAIAGEVVGVADTGADLSSCSLHDPAAPQLTSLTQAQVGMPGMVYNSSIHRKLAQYYSLFGGKAARPKNATCQQTHTQLWAHFTLYVDELVRTGLGHATGGFGL